MRELWKHQKYALEQFSEKDFFGLLFPCGTGKTATAARIAEEKDMPVLIIAPNALCSQWEQELTNHNKDTRITTKEWDVVVCTSKAKKTKKFREALDRILET